MNRGSGPTRQEWQERQQTCDTFDPFFRHPLGVIKIYAAVVLVFLIFFLKARSQKLALAFIGFILKWPVKWLENCCRFPFSYCVFVLFSVDAKYVVR